MRSEGSADSAAAILVEIVRAESTMIVRLMGTSVPTDSAGGVRLSVEVGTDSLWRQVGRSRDAVSGPIQLLGANRPRTRYTLPHGPVRIPPQGATIGTSGQMWIVTSLRSNLSGELSGPDAVAAECVGLSPGDTVECVFKRTATVGEGATGWLLSIGDVTMDTYGARRDSHTVVQGPASVYLSSPRPNPTRRGVTIPFGLARGEQVALQVFDAQGRLIRTLIHERLGPGDHWREWDLRDTVRRRVKAGLYFARLVVGGNAWRRPFVVLD